MATGDELLGEPLKVLLVEDNPSHAELVKRSFANHRVANHIYHVTNGEAALDFLFRRNDYADPGQSPRPKVVLLDLRLPRIDGLEVLREIKDSPELSKMPVVILTTSSAEQDVARAYEHRANSYLVKPVDFSMFRGLMDSLVVYWLALNHCNNPWKLS